jgi:hypothetical protein
VSDDDSLMTVQDVRNWVRRIARMAHDDEGAHSEEDHLFVTLLTHIAEGRCPEPEKCAKAAIRSRMINFSRWCA